jgi:importin-4
MLPLLQLRANPAALEPVMMRVFMNDTEQIKAAEEILKQYTKKPASVPVLLGIMKTSAQPQVRQLAAVLLKKKIVAHWPKFTPQQGLEIKATLLEAVVQEPVKLVRHAVATLMARLSKQLFAEQQTGWPEMLQFVAQCAQQKESEDHRELAFVILHELTETIGDVLESHFGTLKSLFLQVRSSCQQHLRNN